MSQVQIPIRIIVFDELELIIFVSQGLTLSTASLVYLYFFIDTLDRFMVYVYAFILDI